MSQPVFYIIEAMNVARAPHLATFRQITSYDNIAILIDTFYEL
ncbi:Uncharacterised protein [Mammaliicoccus lentus]|nr:Uncharacterised protein [Mammaliicoccus lentus]